MKPGSVSLRPARGFWFNLALFVLFLAGCCRLAEAQVYSGSLTLVVTDPSGAVVPAAHAVLTDEEKGYTFASITDNEGRCIFRNLRPSSYGLKVTSPGMEPYVQSGITLNVGQNASVNAQFAVQGTAETVQVTAASTLLQTQDASTGQLVNQKFINDLPLTSRSVFNLAELSPGVTQAPGGSFGLNAGAVNFISNGGRNSTARHRHGRGQPDQPGE